MRNQHGGATWGKQYTSWSVAAPDRRSDLLAMGSTIRGFTKNVFINCPFDEDYRSLLRPLLFTIVSFGFFPRVATERSDSGEIRLSKICKLIKGSRYSIHDLSRMRAKERGAFQRMNMPFELGVDYGTRVSGLAKMRGKRFLILEKNRYAFHKSISDISGFDIKAHNNRPVRIIQATREWFVETVGLRRVPGYETLWSNFTDFTTALSRKEVGFSVEELNRMPIPEYVDFLQEWVGENHPPRIKLRQ